MIAIIDYDAGNLKSVEKAFQYLHENVIITRDFKELRKADKVILPGVGAFGDAMDQLHKYGLVEPIREIASCGTPFLGICLGLQLLFDGSEENGGVEGLCVLRGRIRHIPLAEGLKIPHIGWNSLTVNRDKRLFQNTPNQSYVYFVHSYYLEAHEESDVAAVTEYGTTIHAAVERGNLFACQFHPEKSGVVGLNLLKNFCSL